MDLVPINERIIVVPKDVVESSGIYVPRNAKSLMEKPEVGFIIAMDTAIENPKCIIGDKIVFNKFAATDITHKRKKYIVMLESSILAIFSRDKVDEEEKKKYMESKEDEA